MADEPGRASLTLCDTFDIGVCGCPMVGLRLKADGEAIAETWIDAEVWREINRAVETGLAERCDDDGLCGAGHDR